MLISSAFLSGCNTECDGCYMALKRNFCSYMVSVGAYTILGIDVNEASNRLITVTSIEIVYLIDTINVTFNSFKL